MTRSRALTASLMLVAAVLADCTGVGDRSGGPGGATVLVLASNDVVGLPPAVSRFVDRVAQLSGDHLQVRVAEGWRGGNDEPRVVRDVIAGRADLGWAGTRVFDVVGDDAFEPLHAPFLVGSHAAEAKIVGDPLASELLHSLDAIGLTGLGLLADQLRVPAALDRPVLTPEDLRGATFGVFDSRIQQATVVALGARPAPGVILQRPEPAGLDVLETMWGSYLGNAQYEVLPFVTANIVFWPRTTVVFGNRGRIATLTAEQQGWLDRAGRDAMTWSARHSVDREVDQLRQACANGARVAAASTYQLAALRRAAEPVYARLRADPVLARILGRVETLVRAAGRDRGPPIPPECSYHAGDETRIPPPVRQLTGPGRVGDLPAGRYRIAFTVGELRKQGEDERTAKSNGGVWTWTLGNGNWRFDLKVATTGIRGPGVYADCAGWYDVQGATAVFTTTTQEADGGECAPPSWSARWSAPNEDTVSWTAVSVAEFSYLFGARPWQRLH